jgi:hypothetical protein
MRLRFVPALLVSIVAVAAQVAAQDLAPRAYVITAVHSNAVTITWSFYNGAWTSTALCRSATQRERTTCQSSATTTR